MKSILYNHALRCIFRAIMKDIWAVEEYSNQSAGHNVMRITLDLDPDDRAVLRYFEPTYWHDYNYRFDLSTNKTSLTQKHNSSDIRKKCGKLIQGLPENWNNQILVPHLIYGTVLCDMGEINYE